MIIKELKKVECKSSVGILKTHPRVKRGVVPFTGIALTLLA